MTRAFVCAAVLTTVVCSPLAAQNSPSSGGTAPPSRYKLQAPPKTTTKSATAGPSQPSDGKRPVLGPAAPPRTTTDRSVRQAGDTQPIREPAAGQTPKRPIVGPVARPQDAGPPQPPVWFPLEANVQKFLDDVLAHWEQTSNKVQYYECAYKKWTFEPIFGVKNSNNPRFFSKGEIKYQSPDKGLLRDVVVWEYVGVKPDEDPNAKPKAGQPPPGWKDALERAGEHWVCDGVTIFQYDSRQERVHQFLLPDEMQGQGIANGPLPFLFGARANDLKRKYWIRPLSPPEGVENEYWLEAVPRFREDAQNFQKVVVVLAKEDFFPSKLSVYPPQYDPKRNPARQDYVFADRKSRKKGDLDITPKDLLFWKAQFYKPKIPKGWTLEPPQRMQPVNDVAQQPPPQARQVKPRTKFK